MVELSEEGEEQKKDDWKSVKIKASTKEGLEEMGVGIGKAVEMLVEAKRSAVTDKIDDISGITEEIADILLESGLLDITFRGSGVEKVSMEDDCIIVHGYIRAGIVDDNARQEIFEVIKRGLEGET